MSDELQRHPRIESWAVIVFTISILQLHCLGEERVMRVKALTFGALSFFDSTKAGDNYVAVAKGGAFASSPNLYGWARDDVLVPGSLTGIAAGNGVTVMCGHSNTLLVQEQGKVAWIPAESGFSDDTWLRDAYFYDSTFFVVSPQGVSKSYDGKRWQATPLAGADTLATANGSYVLTGIEKSYWVSDDAHTWREKLLPDDIEPNRSANRNRLSSDHKGRFVWFRKWDILVSTDGHNWEKSAERPVGSVINNAFAGGLFHVITIGGEHWTSINGHQWQFVTELDPLPSPLSESSTPDSNHWLLENGWIWSTDEGWRNSLGSDSMKRVESLAFSNGRYVAVDSSGEVFTSGNGATWKRINPVSEPKGLAEVVSVPTGFLMNWSVNLALTSKDGENWTPHTKTGDFRSMHGVHRIRWLGDHFIGLNNNYIYRSEDGIHWTELHHNPTSAELVDVAFGEGVHLILREDGGILRSTDSENFELVRSESRGGTFWNSITFGAQGFLAVGRSPFFLPVENPMRRLPQMMQSDDGVTWVTLDPDYPDYDLREVIWADGQYVIAANSILVSPDLKNWRARGIVKRFNPFWRVVPTGGGTCVAGGYDGIVARLEYSIASHIEDRDRDGISDAAEIMAGTSPDDPHSFFRVKVTPFESTIRLTWPQVIGARYVIDRLSEDHRWEEVHRMISNENRNSHTFIADSLSTREAIVRVRLDR